MLGSSERWRWLGVAALGTAAAAALPVLLHTGSPFALSFFGLHAIGAYCMARRSVTHQVIGQGVATALAATHVGTWLVALRRPALFTSTSSLLALAGVVALLTTLPFWRSQIAKQRFAPLVSRSVFLAGAIGSVAIAARLVHAALRETTIGNHYFGVVSVVLATMLLAQATAVVRMRGWGVLLATATGAGCVIPALVLHDYGAWLTALATLTSACLVVPVLFGRRTTAPTATRERVSELEPSRTRIAYEEHQELELEPHRVFTAAS